MTVLNRVSGTLLRDDMDATEDKCKCGEKISPQLLDCREPVEMMSCQRLVVEW